MVLKNVAFCHDAQNSLGLSCDVVYFSFKVVQIMLQEEYTVSDRASSGLAQHHTAKYRYDSIGDKLVGQNQSIVS